jgi:hypothetical protein
MRSETIFVAVASIQNEQSLSRMRNVPVAALHTPRVATPQLTVVYGKVCFLEVNMMT